MQINNPDLARAQPATRSRITNGSALLDGVDGRSKGARRYRDVIGRLLAQLDREPTEADQCLARRAAALAVEAERYEAAQTRGEAVDGVAMATVANALRRLLADLGLSGRRHSRVTPQAPIRERLARA